MSIAIAGLAILVGVLSLQHPRLAAVLFLGFGIAGAAAAGIRPAAGLPSLAPSVIGGLGGIAALLFLRGRLFVRASSVPTGTSRAGMPAPAPSRRGFLVGAAGIGLIALGSGWAGLLISGRRATTAATGSIAIPTPVDLASPIPAGSDLGIEGVAPFTTPNASFYRVDTALLRPGRSRGRGAAHPRHGRSRGHADLRPTARAAARSSATSLCTACRTRWAGSTSALPAGSARGWRTCSMRSASTRTRTRSSAVHRRHDDRHADRGRDGRPRRDARGRHERPTAAAGARLPGAHGRARPLRLCLGHQVGGRHRADPFADTTPYWVERGWAQQGADQDDVAHRHAASAQQGQGRTGRRRRRRVGATPRHRDGRGSRRRRRPGPRAARRVPSTDTWRQWVYEWERHRGNTPSRYARPTARTVQPKTRAKPFPSGATGWQSTVVTVA